MLAQSARLVDMLVVALGGVSTHYLVGNSAGYWTNVDLFLLVFNSLGVLVLFPGFGIYQSWRGKQIDGLIVRAVFAWAVVLIIAMAVVFGLQRTYNVSRGWVGVWAIVSGALLVLSKTSFYAVLRRIRRHGLNQRAIAIVGAGAYCQTLLSRIRTSPQAGFHVVCMLEESIGGEVIGIASEPAQISDVPVLTEFAALAELVRLGRVHEIWLALPLSEERNIIRYMREFRNDFVNIRFKPELVQSFDCRFAGLASHQPHLYRACRAASAAEADFRPRLCINGLDLAFPFVRGDRCRR